MTDHQERQRALMSALEERILVLDGAMGTMLQQAHLGPADFGGPHLEGCNENLNQTRPDVVLGIHRAYFEAGADIVETNTFGCARIVLAEYGLQDSCGDLNRTARATGAAGGGRVLHAREAALRRGLHGPHHQGHHRHRRRHFRRTAGDAYHEQAKALVEGGADFLLLETCQDTRNVKAGLLGIEAGWARTSATRFR